MSGNDTTSGFAAAIVGVDYLVKHRHPRVRIDVGCLRLGSTTTDSETARQPRGLGRGVDALVATPAKD